jgi:spermidine synthase
MNRRTVLPLGFAVVLVLCAAALAEQNVLYEKASPFNTILVTEDDQGLRTLRFERGGCRQSVVKVGDPNHLELPYARSMPAALALVEKPRRVLIVGLGGGTIPGFLHKHYPQTTIDAVDIDPDVVEVAKRFFGFREDATLHAYVQDGRRFIEECREPYDLIFLDAFGSDSIPYQLATREFLQAVRRALAPGGVAVGNVWSSASNPLYDSMVRTYQDVFDTLCVLEVPGAGNRILLALPQAQQVRREELAREATRVSQEKQFGFDMGALVLQGFRLEAARNPRARVLTDSRKE